MTPSALRMASTPHHLVPTDKRDGENYLRSSLRIGNTQRIALQAGMINDIACCQELARGFAGLSDWTLVLHDRHERSALDPFLVHLRQLNRGNLRLSLKPLPYDQIHRIISSADVGLAFYHPKNAADVNFSRVSSSGKLPHYLQHGKPVLVSTLPSLTEIVESFECGIAIRAPSNSEEVGAALECILSKYATFSANALVCFRERFEFGKFAQPLIEFCDRL
jgi:glycosyltransferase involved in cell wall biosynthesis